MLKPHYLRMPRLMFVENGEPAGGGTDDPPANPTPDPAEPNGAPAAGEPASPPEPGEEHLGDPGKRALDAMKAKLKAERDARAKAEADLAAARAAAEGREAEHAAAVEAQRMRDEALKGANERIVRSEVKAVAARHLADPQDALRFLELSDFDVTDEGDVDTAAIESAIADLIARKPYLAAQSGPRFEGSGDGGARKGDDTKSQLTRADLENMTPAEINEARRQGRLKNLGA